MPSPNAPQQLLVPAHNDLQEMRNGRRRVVNLHASAHIDAQHRRITMLYEILPGPAWRSYGIHVAQIANFPQEIISEAGLIEASILRPNERLESSQVEEGAGAEHALKRQKVA